MVAPHTSNFDFFIGRIAYYSSGLKIKFLIKQEAFIFPFQTLLRSFGGIPVNRSKKSNLVQRIVHMFENNDRFLIAVTPEGTRKLSTEWKKGFYFIAQQAKVPIALGYIDYKKKEGGYGPIITPSGDYEKDLKFIEDFYRNITPKHPEKFNLSPQKGTSSKREKTVDELKNQYCCRK